MKNIFEGVKDYESLINIKNYSKGEHIFLEGKKCENVCIVNQGMVSIITPTYNGDSIEINHLKKNELFGDSLIMANDNRYLGDVVSLDNTTLIIIDKNNWFKLLENKIFLKNYLEIVSNKVIKIQSRVKVLSQKSIREKIMFYLFTETKRLNNKEIIIRSKEELALYLNIPRPSLSRELISLKNEGIIDYSKHIIKLL